MRAEYTTKIQRLIGGLKADPPGGAAKDARDAVLAECERKHNSYVTIRFSTPHRPRSTGDKSQNHHLNGHCQQISVETGQPFADVKRFVKQRAIDRGYPILYNEKNKPIRDFWGQEQGISEKYASVEECALLIEESHRLAAELGVILREGEE